MISVGLNMQCDEGGLCFFMLMSVREQLKKRGTRVKGIKVIKKYIFLQFLQMPIPCCFLVFMGLAGSVV